MLGRTQKELVPWLSFGDRQPIWLATLGFGLMLGVSVCFCMLSKYCTTKLLASSLDNWLKWSNTACARTCIHAHLHARAHAYTRARAHTYTHTNTHILCVLCCLACLDTHTYYVLSQHLSQWEEGSLAFCGKLRSGRGFLRGKPGNQKATPGD